MNALTAALNVEALYLYIPSLVGFTLKTVEGSLRLLHRCGSDDQIPDGDLGSIVSRAHAHVCGM
jgi:hypothetical protein